MCVNYCNFLSFRFHWALLACLRWSLGTLGLPRVPLDGHWGSIRHLCGSIGGPLGCHWAPFVAFGGPLGRLWGHFGGHFAIIFALIFMFAPLNVFISFQYLFKEKTCHEASQV